MISSFLRFIGAIEVELCPLIFLGRLIFAVVAVAYRRLDWSLFGLVQHWVWVQSIFCRSVSFSRFILSVAMVSVYKNPIDSYLSVPVYPISPWIFHSVYHSVLLLFLFSGIVVTRYSKFIAYAMYNRDSRTRCGWICYVLSFNVDNRSSISSQTAELD